HSIRISPRRAGNMRTRLQRQTDTARQEQQAANLTGLRPALLTRMTAYATAILRGLTCSAFGRVNVTTPCSIFALILLASIDGSSSNERRKFSGRDSRWIRVPSTEGI